MKRINKDKDMVKSRLIILSKMFYTQTDEEHMMTNLEILDYLKEHDVPANEKTLRGDIRLLRELGFDIVTVVSRPNRYYQGKKTQYVLNLHHHRISSSSFRNRVCSCQSHVCLFRSLYHSWSHVPYACHYHHGNYAPYGQVVLSSRYHDDGR